MNCSYCGIVAVGFGQTRCNTETCYLSHIEKLESQLAAATARASELEKELARFKSRRFPVLGGGMTVPWLMVAPCAPQAYENHSQTLERLAERGGLCWTELLCVLECRRWNDARELSEEAAKVRVLALVSAFNAGLLATDGEGGEGG